MKKAFSINGSAAVGNDTFVELATQYHQGGTDNYRYDITIDNSGTLYALVGKMEKFCRELSDRALTVMM